MSIEVHVRTSVNPLRNCIKVLSEHIRCTERIIFLNYVFSVLLSLSLPRTLFFFLSFPLNLHLGIMLLPSGASCLLSFRT